MPGTLQVQSYRILVPTDDSITVEATAPPTQSGATGALDVPLDGPQPGKTSGGAVQIFLVQLRLHSAGHVPLSPPVSQASPLS